MVAETDAGQGMLHYVTYYHQQQLIYIIVF